MQEWKKCQEEAAKRDRRKRGRVCTFLNLQTFYIFIILFSLTVLTHMYFLQINMTSYVI